MCKECSTIHSCRAPAKFVEYHDFARARVGWIMGRYQLSHSLLIWMGVMR